MKSYYGRKVRRYKYNTDGKIVKYKSKKDILGYSETGYLLEIDVKDEHVMIEDEAGRLLKLHYKLVKLL